MTVQNSKGKIWYGLHMVDGVAEYHEPGQEPYRVFLNENTLRKMDSTFSARPVYVSHVDGVPKDVSEMRREADGVVVRSFYNEADGKHWTEFITMSDEADRAIEKKGMRLSNCYIPTEFGPGGQWNGVDYIKEITNGEYEHLAIVPNPRYEESMILTPEQFKKYNEDKKLELTRLANEKKGEKSMFKFFKREKVENSIDIEAMSVLLPKSKKEVSISHLINEADELEVSKGKPKMVNSVDTVEVDGETIAVAELVKRYVNMKYRLENEDDKEDEKKENEDDDKEDEKKENDDDLEVFENEDDDDKEDEKKDNKKKNSSQKKTPHPNAVALKNAESKAKERRLNSFTTSMDGVARGKARYGSSKIEIRGQYN